MSRVRTPDFQSPPGRRASIARRDQAHILAACSDPERNLLLLATFHLIGLELDCVANASAVSALVAADRPDLIIVDSSLAGVSTLCVELKNIPANAAIPIIELANADPTELWTFADLRLAEPFGPLELLGAANEVLDGGLYELSPKPVRLTVEEQLVLATYDLRRIVEGQDGERIRVHEECWQQTAKGLVQAIALRHDETGAHSFRVQSYAHALALELEPILLADRSIELGFLLHDVGKLAIPDRILLKPGPLSTSEMDVMRMHVIFGEQILAGLLPLAGMGAAVVRSHHERWDGTGYPDGLAGTEISIGARIFAVADALDAMTSDRPYRPARTWGDAIATINRSSGTHFDPTVVAALNHIEAYLHRLREQISPEAEPESVDQGSRSSSAVDSLSFSTSVNGHRQPLLTAERQA